MPKCTENKTTVNKKKKKKKKKKSVKKSECRLGVACSAPRDKDQPAALMGDNCRSHNGQ